ncbi:hypothetical protein GCM10027443_43250 [Pontibacter brevis]
MYQGYPVFLEVAKIASKPSVLKAFQARFPKPKGTLLQCYNFGQTYLTFAPMSPPIDLMQWSKYVTNYRKNVTQARCATITFTSTKARTKMLKP